MISLALPSGSMTSRTGSSLVSAAGLSELVASSYEEYEQKAISLAKDKPRIQALKQHLIRRDSPLFDTPKFVSHLEVGLKEAWDRYKNDQPLDHIEVSKLIANPNKSRDEL